MALQHLRSSTADKRPTPGAMSDGQLALNTNLVSPGLFFKDSNGDSVKIGPIHVGSTAPNATPGAGGQAGNSKGEAWLDTSATNPILKVFNGSAFVAVQPVGTGTVVSTTDTGTVTSTMILDGTILNADINASAAIADTKLATISTAGKVSNSATTATNANTASAIVARDASGNFTAGTITAASLIPTGSSVPTDGVYLPAANTVGVATSGNERLRVTSAGAVGVNTSAPNAQFEVNGSARLGSFNTPILPTSSNVGGCHFSWNRGVGSAETNICNLYDNASTSFEFLQKTGASTANVLYQISSTNHIWSISNTERARIDSGGRLLVGTSSARSNFYNTTITPGKIQVEGTSFTDSGAAFISSGNNAEEPILALAKARGGLGATTIVNNGDSLGSVVFVGADGTEFVESASIKAFVDGTPGANDMPGRIVLSTTADGASSPTERMRITAAGHIYAAGATGGFPGSSNTAVGFLIERAGDGATVFISRTNNAAQYINRNSDGVAAFFQRSGNGVGSISVTSSATAYNTTSDYRLKENVIAVADGITRLQQLKPIRFNFIVDPDKTVDGFIAHEVQEVVPEAIHGEKDAVDDDGNPLYQGIDQSKLVPLLTAALQEAIAKIESLEARLSALEAQ